MLASKKRFSCRKARVARRKFALSGAGMERPGRTGNLAERQQIVNLTQGGEIHMADLQQLKSRLLPCRCWKAAELVKITGIRLVFRRRRRPR